MLAEADDTIWRKLWPVFGRDPSTTSIENCFHGGDGKLDIYLRNRTTAPRRARRSPIPGRAPRRAAYIVFYAGAELPTRWELAHELTHAFQFAFPLSSCSSFDHFDEAVATWGGQYVYPHDDREHEFTWFTKEPSTPLADATYDGWVFPYALEQLYGPGVMQRIYEQGATQTAMHAIDAGVPGGLAKAYPEFAQARLEPRPGQAELLGVGRLRPRCPRTWAARSSRSRSTRAPPASVRWTSPSRRNLSHARTST